MTEDGKSAWSTIGTRDTKKKNPMMRTKTPMQDEIKPTVHDGQEGRNDFAKPPKDLKYPGNSLYYSGPSKMIETHVTNKRDMKDDDWVDSVSLSPRQRFQALNYMELDDESLEMVIKDVRREWERRQKERYDLAVKRKEE